MVLCCCQNAEDAVADKRAEIATMEQKGLKRCTPPTTIPRQCVAVTVEINVYSLLEQNKRLKKLGMGVYHCGVVVYGIEWGYGECVESANASGLFCVYPGQAAGKLYRTVCLGVTTRSPQQVDTVLHRLENEWCSSDYHILNHNCNHFAQRFCDLLSTVQKLRVPLWCNRAARVCNRIVPKRLATYLHRLVDEEPPKARVSDLSRVGELPESVIPRDWYLHPSISQQPRYTTSYLSGEAIPSPLKVVMSNSYSPCANRESNTRTDLDTGLDETGPALATSNTDLLHRISLECNKYSPSDASLPLLQNMQGVLHLATGSGMCLPGPNVSPAATTLRVGDGGWREERGESPLESQASQDTGSHMAPMKHGEEHTGITDVSTYSDDHVQRDIAREEAQSNNEGNENESVFYAALHASVTVDMDGQSVSVQAEEKDLLSMDLSSALVIINDDAAGGTTRGGEDMKQETGSDTALVTDNSDGMHSTDVAALRWVSSEKNNHFGSLSSSSSSVEEEQGETWRSAKLRNEGTLFRSLSYPRVKFPRLLSHDAKRRTTVIGNTCRLSPPHPEEKTSPGSCLTLFSGVGSRPPLDFAAASLGDAETSTSLSGSFYSNPEGGNEDGSCLRQQEDMTILTPVVEEASRTSIFKPLSFLYSSSNLRRIYSWSH
ncbi:hypothetical protein TraAM80_06511 [Trypanosoma rangeli]|uniref:PPPDE domain-containing protein n=1 Tax=Trypanosoma rangeli TaxID=5698 RepID=A0A422N9Q1_TRYRA|nr:uncharacterized protein TraAM80_06511 [Trypanosoma rangeli]RNF02218.1 hypothetical protein TraAM80_06511 [Trypanosoma rangeli]|eukprot:RNF02218.1 hypothetical protein TraAM80_06511 [Trypanosoma rangeli]